MALIEHLEKLRHFYKITQYNSINEASQKTGYSQAGLSKSLQLLEEELKCKLFKRSREGLSLTKEGIEVKHFAQQLIESSSNLEQKLKTLSSVQTPKILRIGMYDSIAIYFGVQLSEYLNQVYPNVALEISADSSATLLKSVKNESLDLAIGVHFHNEESNKLKYFDLFEDHYSIYSSSKNSNLETEGSVIIHSSATDKEGLLSTDLFKNELKGKRIHQVTNFETLKQLVASGLGIGILPTLVARPLIQQGQILAIQSRNSKSFRGKHNIGVVVRNEVLSLYNEFILDIIRLGDRWIQN